VLAIRPWLALAPLQTCERGHAHGNRWGRSPAKTAVMTHRLNLSVRSGKLASCRWVPMSPHRGVPRSTRNVPPHLVINARCVFIAIMLTAIELPPTSADIACPVCS
jgi:hypothetical protein